MKNIVNQQVRDDSYKNFQFLIANDKCSDKFNEIYNKYLKKEELSDCFELGCFPGRYLAYICKLGNYEANGADVTSELNDGFIEWLKSNKIRVGKIVREDVFNYIDKLQHNRKAFDLTYSLGFIEHFTDFLDVIDYHIKITKKNGYIYITTPNFAGGYQRFMHRWLDRPNYNNHVVDSMNPKKWYNFLESKGCKVLEYGYFGNFDFWVENQERNLIKKLFVHLNVGIACLQKYIPLPNCRFYSPFCYIVAKKM